MKGPALRRMIAALVLGAIVLPAAAADVVTIGSKKFTESVILGEMVRILARSAGHEAVHRRELGGTRVLWSALRKGDLDIYPEYTGTLMYEILAGEGLRSVEQLRTRLSREGLRLSAPLGFNNSYVLAMPEALAKALGVRTISDLRDHPDLVLGFGNEFMDRADGWPGLKRRYRLPQENVQGLDHDLAYRGIAAGSLQVTDAYATDSEIEYYGLRLLEDDLGYFPAYDAVLLYRADLEARAPRLLAGLQRLAGRIDAAAMRSLNARVKLDGESETAVAAEFLRAQLGISFTRKTRSRWQQFLQHTKEHLLLVAISLSAAIAVAIPLGVLAARHPRSGQVILSATGLIQTIPSLALLVFMIPLLGIGGPPAVVALFLYSLLPVVRNTHAGLTGIPRDLIESADALGLPARARLRMVELPLATPSILAGIKTSAVINVGTATLAALIGAGGLGDPIVTGLSLRDSGLILQGAIPAALLAIVTELAFEALERLIVPPHLRRGKRGQGG